MASTVAAANNSISSNWLLGGGLPLRLIEVLADSPLPRAQPDFGKEAEITLIQIFSVLSLQLNQWQRVKAA